MTQVVWRAVAFFDKFFSIANMGIFARICAKDTLFGS